MRTPDDTDIGGSPAPFPPTRHSAVQALGSGDRQIRERAFSAIVENYWKPVYAYLRAKWKADNEEAKDLTQAFFARQFETGQLARFDPARAMFRTYLRLCLDGFVSNERKAAKRLKRGGDQVILSLDFARADADYDRSDPPAPDADLDEYFDREWIRALFTQALERLRRWAEANARLTHLHLFEAYDLAGDDGEPPGTYADLARRFDLPVTQVNNYLAETRREFRRFVLEQLRAATGSESEYRAEARRVLGVDPP